MEAGSAQQMKGWRTQAPAGRDDLSPLSPHPTPSHFLGQMTNPEPIASKAITMARDGRRSRSCVSAPNRFWQLWILQPWVFFPPHHVDSVEVSDWLPVLLVSVSAAQSKALFHSEYLAIFSTGQCHCRHLDDNKVSQWFIVWIPQSCFGSNGIQKYAHNTNEKLKLPSYNEHVSHYCRKTNMHT